MRSRIIFNVLIALSIALGIASLLRSQEKIIKRMVSRTQLLAQLHGQRAALLEQVARVEGQIQAFSVLSADSVLVNYESDSTVAPADSVSPGK